MRRVILLALLALAFTVGSLTLTGASASDDANDDGSGGRTLDLTSISKELEEIDVGDEGLSVGDYFVFSDNVFEDGDRVGTLDGACTHTRITEKVMIEHCMVTVSLPDGQLTGQGSIRIDEDFDEEFTTAITGGTGDFVGADGEATVTFVNDEEIELHVVLDD